jgi:hypothetical protein
MFGLFLEGDVTLYKLASYVWLSGHRRFAMARPVLTDKHFQDEPAAFALVEAAPWPEFRAGRKRLRLILKL